MTTYLKLLSISAVQILPQQPLNNQTIPSIQQLHNKIVKVCIRSKKQNKQYQQYLLCTQEVTETEDNRSITTQQKQVKKNRGIVKKLRSKLGIGKKQKNKQKQKQDNFNIQYITYKSGNINENNIFIISDSDNLQIYLQIPKTAQQLNFQSSQNQSSSVQQQKYKYSISSSYLKQKISSKPQYSYQITQTYPQYNKMSKQFITFCYQEEQNNKNNIVMNKYKIIIQYQYKYKSYLVYNGCFGNLFYKINNNNRSSVNNNYNNNISNNNSNMIDNDSNIKDKNNETGYNIKNMQQRNGNRNNSTIYTITSTKTMKIKTKQQLDQKSQPKIQQNNNNSDNKSIKISQNQIYVNKNGVYDNNNIVNNNSNNKVNSNISSNSKINSNNKFSTIQWKYKQTQQQPIFTFNQNPVLAENIQPLNSNISDKSQQTKTLLKKIQYENNSNMKQKQKSTQSDIKINKQRINFYKGPCKNKNMFSCMDAKIEEQQILHVLQPHYN